MKFVDVNNKRIAVIDQTERIETVQDAIDLMANAQYLGESNKLVIFKESLLEDFFDLKTRFAGEILQKFSNYNVQLAIIGDFSKYNSKALRDFIYECNKGNLVFWANSLDDALKILGQ